MAKNSKPRYTPNELAEMVWNYGQNFPMRKVRGEDSYQPVKNPKKFLEAYKLTFEEYLTGLKVRVISHNK